MTKLAKHTWINFLSFLAALLVGYIAYSFFTNQQPSTSDYGADNALGKIGDTMGAILLFVIFCFIILIIWSIRVIWVIVTYWQLHYLILINVLMVLTPWAPIIARQVETWSHSYENKIRRSNNLIVKDEYNTIEYPYGGLVSWTVNNDTILVALREVDWNLTRNAPSAKYYALSGKRLIEVGKSRIRHLLVNNGETSSKSHFDSRVELFAERKFEPHINMSLEKVNKNPFPKTYIYDAVNHKNIDSLEGFENLTHAQISFERNTDDGIKVYSFDDKGALYFPLWNYSGGLNGTETFYIAKKNKNQKIQMREVDLNSIPQIERQWFSNTSFRNIRVQDNYIYFLMHNKIYYKELADD